MSSQRITNDFQTNTSTRSFYSTLTKKINEFAKTTNRKRYTTRNSNFMQKMILSLYFQHSTKLFNEK